MIGVIAIEIFIVFAVWVYFLIEFCSYVDSREKSVKQSLVISLRKSVRMFLKLNALSILFLTPIALVIYILKV